MWNISWIFTIVSFFAVLLSQFFAYCNARNITLGILLPFKTDSGFLSDNRQQARYYAGMIPYAVNTINSDPNLLSNHTLNFIWKDTECRTDKALRGMVRQWTKKVDAFIGLGCYCDEPARLASALRLPVISNVRHWIRGNMNQHCSQQYRNNNREGGVHREGGAHREWGAYQGG